MIEINQIIKNLIPTEPVTIIKLQPLGNMYSIKYTGVNTHKTSTKVISKAQFESLEVLTAEGEFNFKGDPEKFVMFAEAERIHSAYQFDPLFAINCSVVDPLPHQVEAVYKYLLPQPKIRFLLADDTGAGKTIMTGLLLKELIMRGIIERILIVTPGGLTKQWQEDEMGVKFNIPFTLVNRSLFTADPNIFRTANKVVTSIDFISREDILSVVSNTSWDMVIFDEAHKLSAYEYGQKTYKSKRYEAAYVLSQQCEHLLLLTATPHRGRTDTFKKLLQLLDEDIFATDDVASDRVKELSKEGLNKFFIRRLKEDMKDWDGHPLYKKRFTKTISYQLTPEEKYLYDQVTNYLTRRKEEATEEKNIHVSLALAVMQRRLVSSIYAIKNTLYKRWNALQGIVDEVNKNPNIWKQRQKLELIDVDNIDQYDDLEDDEKDALDNILSDPKKFKLFTTSKSLAEIANEAQEVKRLYDIANHLYNQNQEEKKYIQLKELLKSQGVINGQKLVIFTEHKDTLTYLQERLTNNGYKVSVIHGGLSVDERRAAQWEFMSPETQILIATDAAGEGINLQFCRLLINWDIPWNPNRLEQRMGRIHRYGQKEDVLVFNLVADNTREGQVLAKLLNKLDIIRESMGDDRVYDVIQDVLKDVSLEAIIASVFDGKESDLDRFLAQNNQEIEKEFKCQIEAQQKAIAHSPVDYKNARLLKEDSDEKRLQPIYIQLFFERTFKYLGGRYENVQKGIYKITTIPEILSKQLKENYNILADNLNQLLFCFDKQIFLDYQNTAAILGKVHYINPGNALFDALTDCVRKDFKEEMLKGTILVSPEDTEEYFAFFVKNQITDNRPNKGDDSIANEQLSFIFQTADGTYHNTSPAKFLDLHAPSQFAKEILPPATIQSQEVMGWAFEHITLPLFEETKVKVEEDVAKRKEYLQTAFSQIIMDLDIAINDMQMKVFMGDVKLQEKLSYKMVRKAELMQRREERIADMEQMMEISPKEPEIIGCAYVVPLTQMEYKQHFHMTRDEEVEEIAMRVAMNYETDQGRNPEDVSRQNLGYDIKSIDRFELKRYIEVKGRAGTDGVMLSENEWNRLAQLGDKAWLYIVINCKTTPELYRIQNPAIRLTFEKVSKGVQYYLPLKEWQQKYEQ
ncbi:helicase-related protein [Phocaeicola barnesiae]|uniref:helicase-related protein n=1 Tax=Phocaeicola barnesiae TaxID=376804 RepID=UPI0025A381A8|nr:helicase-related protein [Phocaeicola barnesiae]MDM8233366.1 helicase-related protein [Phocaeicola barnesiae]